MADMTDMALRSRRRNMAGMKIGALLILGIWLAILALGIWGFGVGALFRGLSFSINPVESAIASWAIVAGLPLISLGMYLYSGNQPE